MINRLVVNYPGLENLEINALEEKSLWSSRTLQLESNRVSDGKMCLKGDPYLGNEEPVILRERPYFLEILTYLCPSVGPYPQFSASALAKCSALTNFGRRP